MTIPHFLKIAEKLEIESPEKPNILRGRCIPSTTEDLDRLREDAEVYPLFLTLILENRQILSFVPKSIRDLRDMKTFGGTVTCKGDFHGTHSRVLFFISGLSCIITGGRLKKLLLMLFLIFWMPLLNWMPLLKKGNHTTAIAYSSLART